MQEPLAFADERGIDKKQRVHVKLPIAFRLRRVVVALIAAMMLAAPLFQANRQPRLAIIANDARPKVESKWPTKTYPVMVQRLGPEIFERATLYVPQVARLVDSKTPCDQVTVVEMENSSRPRSVRYVALCKNGFQSHVEVDFGESRAS
ncbi:hypothetical protein KRR38_27660 [Novosphingobium sp. G106]|uniref:hypothetical protein n=1 Tax=Novosphingobium sp. G106 TaxID=2849500 RepID=UPI001C2D1CCC|nr:hypothetical protein [Novosphingobium sp. G106]MBV1691359.1 hypothetical protein [Novosphingobium sp. G106]